MDVEEKKVKDLNQRDTVVLNGQQWDIYGMSIETNYGGGTVYDIELRNRLNGIRCDLDDVPGHYVLSVLKPKPKPWEGLKVGDLLSCQGGYLVVINEPANRRDQPYLMKLDFGGGLAERPTNYSVGYDLWNYFERTFGPIERIQAGDSESVLGLDFYQKVTKGL